ncbi:MAG: flagellar biosynthetic protein FliR [Zymomonas mobilis subsp. pomaceae]|uniref:Flagellar biosynthetic protein FliR n=1 Tax=Zymomonas mobilis subsp. pomaceae (strain ATCC 29192 / DSM 22645 / JCM 10191 / CCUG 17912 / NBRC 13757 / NCIMB 11200 / NRRL B-4491 / Barker I) TaxID=579138 RepID=F8ERM5_ZYMMT|nr:flagellar biosynthetic protein FliR [Zymomonas mobilis]AEI37483.1 flagellar biosynthetic protein FliR [Zymomonas mobilis subsp. pomaceae ATCC 29192]MDX5948851.1 flagellar biosynthetic protein FliR [Zymomonas mobilis subsp. pomaceae]GEB88658.1 flagellar biosynthetic protein FliR [Zymomonas mobilis subsp. pomaceae]
MIPAHLAEIENYLWIWLVALLRPGAAFVAAPLLGANVFPVTVRIMLALAVGLPAVMDAHLILPDSGLLSFTGFFLVAGEIVTGIAIGFAVQIGYSAGYCTSELIGNAMGLGFASMIDPVNGSNSNVLTQIFTILGAFFFLAADGHLLLIRIIVESYQTMPVGGPGLDGRLFLKLTQFGGQLFSIGMLIALPVTFSIILVQIMMGFLSRTAPALNLFAVGMPMALLIGFLLLAVTAPMISEGFMDAIRAGLDMADQLAKTGATHGG